MELLYVASCREAEGVKHIMLHRERPGAGSRVLGKSSIEFSPHKVTSELSGPFAA